MRVNIYGMGYVGLTLAAALTKVKTYTIRGIDIDEQKIEDLRSGKSHIYEHSLIEKLPLIEFDTLSSEAEVHIICVGTPSSGTLDALWAVTDTLKQHIRQGDLVILRSTVPVGTTAKLKASLPEWIDISYAPERTLAGAALKELETIPQIVSGSDKAVMFFKRLTPDVLKVSSFETAEMLKMTANCWRAWQFAFSNQLALDCSRLGVDVHEVREAGMFNYKRTEIPKPGFTGGPCLTKDPLIYASMFPLEIHPFRRVHMINKWSVIDWIKRLRLGGSDLSYKFFGGDLEVGVIGKTFKSDPKTNDTRDSFCSILDELNIPHQWWDPMVDGSAKWEEVWDNKDVVILAHDVTIGGLTAPRHMKEDGVILDLWGRNLHHPRVKVFGQ